MLGPVCVQQGTGGSNIDLWPGNGYWNNNFCIKHYLAYIYLFSNYISKIILYDLFLLNKERKNKTSLQV
jgi:hypothetical protein